jgi:flagellar basal-body rod protein FlgB
VGLDGIPLFAMFKGRMGWLNARERVIAQNVANSDTPGYRPRDLKAQSFDQHLRLIESGPKPVALARTQANHIAQKNAPSPHRGGASPDSETTLDGNAVVVEEQMLKMAESRMAYDAAIGFYQKSLNMIRMAAKAPAR